MRLADALELVDTAIAELTVLRAQLAILADPTPFPEVLRRERDARRWSQERLAAVAGLDHSQVSRLERGQRAPTRDALARLADGLKLTARRRDVLSVAAGDLPPSVRTGDGRGERAA